MQIRKKWLNQLKNFFNKHFKDIIWHLFAGESYQVVKITVTYSTSFLLYVVWNDASLFSGPLIPLNDNHKQQRLG